MRSLTYFLFEWGSSEFWQVVGLVTNFAWKAYLLLTLYTLWMTNMTNLTKEQIVTVVFIAVFVWIMVDERPKSRD